MAVSINRDYHENNNYRVATVLAAGNPPGKLSSKIQTWRTCWMKGTDAQGHPWYIPGTVLVKCYAVSTHFCGHFYASRGFQTAETGNFTIAVARATQRDGASCKDPYVAAVVPEGFFGGVEGWRQDSYYVKLDYSIIEPGRNSAEPFSENYSWQTDHGAHVCSFTLINANGTTTRVAGAAGGYTANLQRVPEPSSIYPQAFNSAVAYVTAAVPHGRIPVEHPFPPPG